jgi:hypothetical protein
MRVLAERSLLPALSVALVLAGLLALDTGSAGCLAVAGTR